MPDSIDVILSPDILPCSLLTGRIVVVADILRATSSITFAMANGATSIVPVLTPDGAFELAANQPDSIIAGERNGKKIDGFHLGNSPGEYTETAVAGKLILLTTTNGTRTFWACRAAPYVLAGSFLNLQSIINFLTQTSGEVVFVCAGREGAYCIEDTVFAGACIASLKVKRLTDAAETARILYQKHRDNLQEMLINSCHGQNLTQIGLARDLHFCAQVDLVDVVPIQIDGQIVVR